MSAPAGPRRARAALRGIPKLPRRLGTTIARSLPRRQAWGSAPGGDGISALSRFEARGFGASPDGVGTFPTRWASPNRPGEAQGSGAESRVGGGGVGESSPEG
ncbi:hypothetical protein GCM10010381_69940 [Streptomyces xantholiticus]|nr:hypothetical protein GCM10010381_69940 [Streptomyces xantholiticus]